MCGPWPLGESGSITFLADGHVAVGISGPVFEEQKRKIISRFNVDDILLADLENALYASFTSLSPQILRDILLIRDQAQFDRRLDVLVSTLRAIRELWFRHFETERGVQFIDAVRALALKHKRPPTKAEITAYLGCEVSHTSKWCREHGFSWLPTERPGRRN